MSLTGLKPPGHLSFEGDLATNWRRWYRAYEYYNIAAGASAKPERVQCSLFLHGVRIPSLHRPVPCYLELPEEWAEDCQIGCVVDARD